MSLLDFHRQELNRILDQWEPRFLQNNWLFIERHIQNWWLAYKKWESQDTFEAAFKDDRMTVRTFDADFDKQVNKKFNSINIAENDKRFFADGKYKPLHPDPEQAMKALQRHSNIFHNTEESQFYHAKRGIDSSDFAVPAYFATREMKYQMGLHDLSASLLNHKFEIWKQVHHKWDNGAHYSFMPLSQEADQEVLHTLGTHAKSTPMFPALYGMVRSFRAEMTRLKLAYDRDMGVGYTAIPVQLPENECRGTRPSYKLRYGLGFTTTGANGESEPVTSDVYDNRRKQARKFKEILQSRGGSKNEVVIAIRRHAGPFPVYAVRDGRMLKCYDIVDNRMRLNGRTISMTGRMT